MRVAAMGASDDALLVDSYFQRNGGQVLEQIRQVRTTHGRMVSRQVTEIDNPSRKNQQDTLSLQGTAQHPAADRALVAALGQLAQPHGERSDGPGRGFSKQEFD